MRFRAIYSGLGLLLALLTGCGQPAAPPPMPQTGPVDAEIPSIMNGSQQVVQVTAEDAMRFNGDRFTVHTGQPVRIELTNIGHKPREEMEHDFVILQPGTDAMMFNLMTAQAKAAGFLPPEQMGQVFAHTDLAGPGQMEAVEFTAPAPGQYPFLCNFPGHYAAGMHGVMTVAP
jgi:azurin